MCPVPENILILWIVDCRMEEENSEMRQSFLLSEIFSDHPIAFLWIL